jgi:hypothetical protein
MASIKENIFDILRGEFLTREDSLKNWMFMLFILSLLLLMIASSHNSDREVMEIAKLNKEVKELRAQFVDLRSKSMKMKLESAIKNKVFVLGLISSENPPQVIKVISKK